MGEPKIKEEVVGDFLDANAWQNIYGESYEKWRKDRWGESCIETRDFLEHVLPLGTVEGGKKAFTSSSGISSKDYLQF